MSVQRAEIEVIIRCQNCQYVQSQGERYTYFSLAMRDYEGMQCPQCGQINWVMIARIAKPQKEGQR